MRQERVFVFILVAAALGMLAIVAGVLFTLVTNSLPSIRAFGLGFLWGEAWNPVSGRFGGLVFLLGTLITSILATMITVPFSLSISVFLGEFSREGIVSGVLRSAIELLAGVPSIIYGFWGLFLLVPVIRSFQTYLGVPAYGVGIFTASLVLAIMIVPYSASIGRDVIALVPSDLKEAAYSLGATRSEVIRKVILPYARSGIMGGVLLAWGRAFGETMAVTMVIGNANVMPTSIFSPSNTMASVIANEFSEATTVLHVSSLVELGLLLFVVTTIVNILGKRVIMRGSV